MFTCYLCEGNTRENTFGYWCENCRKIKNLGNVYGFTRIYNILNKCCIRDELQLEKKIEAQKEAIEQPKTDRPKTRSQSQYAPK